MKCEMYSDTPDVTFQVVVKPLRGADMCVYEENRLSEELAWFTCSVHVESLFQISGLHWCPIPVIRGTNLIG